MINLQKERLLINQVVAIIKRTRAKGMTDEEIAHEIYRNVLLPLHNDVRDEWVALLKSSDGKLN